MIKYLLINSKVAYYGDAKRFNLLLTIRRSGRDLKYITAAFDGPKAAAWREIFSLNEGLKHFEITILRRVLFWEKFIVGTFSDNTRTYHKLFVSRTQIFSNILSNRKSFCVNFHKLKFAFITVTQFVVYLQIIIILQIIPIY